MLRAARCTLDARAWVLEVASLDGYTSHVACCFAQDGVMVIDPGERLLNRNTFSWKGGDNEALKV
jgi:hypothetical protein